MLSLLNIVRNRILCNPAVFTRDIVESSLSPHIFHDKLLCLDQPLPGLVVAWLLRSEQGSTRTPLRDAQTLRLDRGSAMITAGLQLFKNVTRLVLRDCFALDLTLLANLQRVSFRNVSFTACDAATTLFKPPLTSLSIVDDRTHVNFFPVFQHCQSFVSRLIK